MSAYLIQANPLKTCVMRLKARLGGQSWLSRVMLDLESVSALESRRDQPSWAVEGIDHGIETGIWAHLAG
jgi:hypothetical protein